MASACVRTRARLSVAHARMLSRRQVIASYMFEGLHGKLFGSMCDIHSDEDANLLELSGASRESVSLSQVSATWARSCPPN